MTRFHLLAFVALVTALSSCSTQQRTASKPRPANAQLTALHKKKASVDRMESSSTASAKESNATKKLVDKYATMMKVEPALLENTVLVKFIDDWYGVPYKYGGANKSGVDCSGFTCKLYNDVFKHNLTGTSSSLFQQTKRIKRSELQQGDLVFFKIHRGRISHVGVYVANDYFIHASTKAGVVLSSLNEDYYRKYYGGAGRVKNEK